MKYFALTDVGKVRSENQDSWDAWTSADGHDGVLVVCDGMGGANAGSTASKLASENFVSHVRECISRSEHCVADAVALDAAAYANIRLYDRAFTDLDCRGMGTTLVAAVVLGSMAAIVNVGDSRAYLLRDEALQKITTDHSLVEEMLARGKITKEEARNHPRKNVITRALGIEAEVKSDIFIQSLQKRDRILLCTDGLSNQITDAELERILNKLQTPEDCCSGLLDLALKRGAPDNVTVAVLDID